VYSSGGLEMIKFDEYGYFIDAIGQITLLSTKDAVGKFGLYDTLNSPKTKLINRAHIQ
jgi:hypothetical protein